MVRTLAGAALEAKTALTPRADASGRRTSGHPEPAAGVPGNTRPGKNRRSFKHGYAHFVALEPHPTERGLRRTAEQRELSGRSLPAAGSADANEPLAHMTLEPALRVPPATPGRPTELRRPGDTTTVIGVDATQWEARLRRVLEAGPAEEGFLVRGRTRTDSRHDRRPTASASPCAAETTRCSACASQ